MQEQLEDDVTDDEELNITSEKFNPLKALYSKKFKVPKNVRKFDNLSSFFSAMKFAGDALDADLEKDHPRNRKKAEAANVDEEKFHVTAAGRKFLKEQGEANHWL